MRPRIFLGAASLAAGDGGIARVARLCSRALIESGYDVASAALATGSKLLFAARCHASTVSRTHVLYDSAGIARAHPSVPLLDRPYAVWMHGIEAWEALRADRARAFARARLIIANSAYTLERYRALHGDPACAMVCHLATEQDEPAAIPSQRSSPPTVMILGRIERSENYKGHRQLVGCWRRVVAAVPAARLVVAGGGSGLESLRAEVAASPVASHIEVLGHVPETRIDSVWHRAHVFAMPSRREGFGLVYAEAMRHGLPVIASIHDAGAEVNADGVTGYNVDLDREDELPERLIALLRDPGLANALGEAGQRRWREQYRYSSFKRRFLPIMARFIAETS